MSTRTPQSILVTGGAGFIGANLVHHLLASPSCRARIVNVDALTYAGNLASLDAAASNPRYTFVHADITEAEAMARVFADHGIDTVVHLAAETHVDRSIDEPTPFIRTNVLGTQVLLDAARRAWGSRDDVLFHHVSTDEVFGSLGPEGCFDETTLYDPRSPYAASKAASDHLVRAAGTTYGLPYTISNCSNNYGPFQFPEKLIPLLTLKLMEGQPLPIYGDGSHIRDWLHVEDHADALWTIVQRSPAGRTWVVGTRNEQTNLEVARTLCRVYAEATGTDVDDLLARITFVEDRPGHDHRYAVDPSRLETELAWTPRMGWQTGLAQTVRWMLDNPAWIAGIRDGTYRDRKGQA